MAIANPASSTTPPQAFVAVTPSDSNLLLGAQRLYVGGAGNVAIKGINDSAAATLTAVPVGTFIPFSNGYVMATGTTATNIVALY